MNNDEAKFLLRAYRPDGRDANDPAMLAALEQAKKDPALRVWLESQQQLDAAIAQKLQSIAPPAHLRASILAGAKAGRAAQPRRPRWRQPAWLAMAASIALLLSVGAWWKFAPVPGRTLDELALNFVTRGFMLEKRDSDLAELRHWLAARGQPIPETLPAQFADLRALGCRTLQIEGRDVSLVCFERGGKEYHVFVARRNDFPAAFAPAIAGLVERKNHLLAAWHDEQNHYVLVSDAARDAVEQLL